MFDDRNWYLCSTATMAVAVVGWFLVPKNNTLWIPQIVYVLYFIGYYMIIGRINWETEEFSEEHALYKVLRDDIIPIFSGSKKDRFYHVFAQSIISFVWGVISYPFPILVLVAFILFICSGPFLWILFGMICLLDFSMKAKPFFSIGAVLAGSFGGLYLPFEFSLFDDPTLRVLLLQMGFILGYLFIEVVFWCREKGALKWLKEKIEWTISFLPDFDP